MKQIMNREGQKFGFDDYGLLPDILNQPDAIKQDKANQFRFFKQIGENRYLAVIKVLEHTKEMYLQTYHLASDKQWKKGFR